MPGLQELFGIVVVVFVIWLLLKMARVAIRLIFFMLALAFVAGRSISFL